eukprot:jgi/Mesvir1/8797/Mv02701-RA.1
MNGSSYGSDGNGANGAEASSKVPSRGAYRGASGKPGEPSSGRQASHNSVGWEASHEPASRDPGTCPVVETGARSSMPGGPRVGIDVADWGGYGASGGRKTALDLLSPPGASQDGDEVSGSGNGGGDITFSDASGEHGRHAKGGGGGSSGQRGG